MFDHEQERLPLFDILPRMVRSPVEICLGTRPSQAAKSRPLEKTSPVPIAATMALEMSGPMPGMLISRSHPECACLTMAPLAPVSAIGMAASCGAPRRQPRNPPRDVGPEFLVLGAKALGQHRLLVGQDKGVEGEPHEPAVNHETPVAEQDPLAQNDGDDGNVDGIAHVAIQTRHHEVLRRCDRRRRAEPLESKARKRVYKSG